MKEYLIAHFVESPAAEFVAWPLHMTILPWFTVKEPGDEVLEEITQMLADTAPFHARAEKRDFLGPYRIVPVTLIEKTPEIIDLHARCLELVSSHDWKFSSAHYTGEAFLPHVTKKENKEVKPGEVVEVDNLYLVEAPAADPRTRVKKLIGAVTLGGGTDAKEAVV